MTPSRISSGTPTRGPALAGTEPIPMPGPTPPPGPLPPDPVPQPSPSPIPTRGTAPG